MNATETLSVTVPLTVTVQRIKDLLTTAFEGGSNYWVECAERVGEAQDRKQARFLCDCPFIKDGSLRIKDEADAINHNGGWFNINPQTIKEGLQKMAEKYPKAWADFIADNEDASTADVFLQCVCFGETVYG